ncbi:MAG: hypothetical protein ACLFTP_10820 [Rhodosalinus sp.]
MREINRLIRHVVAPLVTYAVAEGWLPEYAQQDVTEALVIALALALPIVWSRVRERLS